MRTKLITIKCKARDLSKRLAAEIDTAQLWQLIRAPNLTQDEMLALQAWKDANP